MARARPEAQPVSGPEIAPRRVLHVLSGIARGGIEIWLLNVLRNLDLTRYPMDFLLTAPSAGGFEAEFRALGCRIIACEQWRRPLAFARNFTEAVRRYGPYDIIHSHIHHYSGVIVWLAARQGIPMRIVHSHNDTRPDEARRGWPRPLYLRAMKQLIRRRSTHRLAVSREAAEDLFGPQWARDRHCEIAHCGLDLTPFAARADRAEARRELGWPEDALVIGHVGRFFWRKNHAFLMDIAAEAFARDPRARLLSLGDGPLMTEIAARAATLGIADRIVFAGARDDVPRWLQAMDVLVFPSHHEGLALVLIEAQASGLPCVLSGGLTEESDVVRPLMHRLSLGVPAADWATCTLAAARQPGIGRAEAYQRVSASDFSIERSAARLNRIYEQCGARTGA